MKTAKAYVLGLYGALALNYLAELVWALIAKFSENGAETGFTAAIIFMGISGVVLFVSHIMGWMAVIQAGRADAEQLHRAIKQMKLYTIPFYLLNFVYQFIVWFIIMAAFRGILFFLLWVPFFFTWLLILESGCVVNRYISRLRSDELAEKKPGKIHYLLQIIPVLDVISTLVVLTKYGKEVPQEV